ncbi:Uncharacterised protein [Burkholderia pseudomallei]|nr:Uncharacterised protein [Burkholderia pseudomallei]
MHEVGAGRVDGWGAAELHRPADRRRPVPDDRHVREREVGEEVQHGEVRADGRGDAAPVGEAARACEPRQEQPVGSQDVPARLPEVHHVERAGRRQVDARARSRGRGAGRREPERARAGRFDHAARRAEQELLGQPPQGDFRRHADRRRLLTHSAGIRGIGSARLSGAVPRLRRRARTGVGKRHVDRRRGDRARGVRPRPPRVGAVHVPALRLVVGRLDADSRGAPGAVGCDGPVSRRGRIPAQRAGIAVPRLTHGRAGEEVADGGKSPSRGRRHENALVREQLEGPAVQVQNRSARDRRARRARLAVSCVRGAGGRSAADARRRRAA